MSRLFLAVLLFGPGLLAGGGLVWIPAPESPSAAPYAEHPPLGHTGGFGEPTCQACHFGGKGNGGDGTLAVGGLPDTVRPGRSYRLSVQLVASMKRAGFMLAVRCPDGTQAGRLSPLDTARVAVHTADSTDVQYAHHTLEGTSLPGQNQSTWALRWRAPETPGDSAVVHVSANAANDDASEFGDEIYTRTVRVAIP